MKNKYTPMRRCIGCMESFEKDKLIRIAYHEGRLTVDPDAKAPGRGVYICKNRECIDKARRKNTIQRSLRRGFEPEETEKIFRELENYEE